MRQQKIARQIQRDMADIFSKEAASFLQGAMVTAKIYVSVFPFDRSTAVMAVLDKQNWLLRRSLGQRVHNQLKTVPEIQFFLDDSLEYIDNIDQLLREEK